jgi:hypothetical protein
MAVEEERGTDNTRDKTRRRTEVSVNVLQGMRGVWAFRPPLSRVLPADLLSDCLTIGLSTLYFGTDHVCHSPQGYRVPVQLDSLT